MESHSGVDWNAGVDCKSTGIIALKRDLLLKNNLPDKVFCPSAYPTPYM